ncbi:TatD family hydrolase [Lacunimicrobium album]
MLLFDSHTHLDEESLLVEVEDIVKTAEETGLVGMLTIGTTLASCQNAIELAGRFPIVHAAVGLHPNYVTQANPGDWKEIVELVSHPQVVAIGETGLDKYWDFAPLEAQRDYFMRHLELSRATGKPFIVHCRDAEDEVVEMLADDVKKGPLNGVMHSFCGSEDMAKKCLEWGMMISFSGMLTYKKNESLRAIAKTIPLDRLLVETDAPYLAPLPYRGKRNQPAYVAETCKVLAEVHGLSAEEMSRQTTENARRWLKLPVT